jgi:hypothetical protein
MHRERCFEFLHNLRVDLVCIYADMGSCFEMIRYRRLNGENIDRTE